MGPSTKQVRVALPRRGESATIKDEWRQHVVDVLEIANAEWHMMQTQLKGVHQAWEAANIELRSIMASSGGLTGGSSTSPGWHGRGTWRHGGNWRVGEAWVRAREL